ncbi:hypothetical protein [Streptomyces sp.]|uniref:hypothetical protein n=1 Tax=Streptomyces sp. TaxID=1931 RepID=UPI002D24B33F|nr:hypothetical protein [Streptomyces sp.]HZF90156.1 hypothetical protein [Streptomyces sp.]
MFITRGPPESPLQPVVVPLPVASRRSSSAAGAEPTAGSTVGRGDGVAACAEVVGSAAATAASTPAAPKGRAMRVRRLRKEVPRGCT